MKPPKLKPILLQVIDLDPHLSPEIVTRVQKVLVKPRFERCRRGKLLLRWIWQKPMTRYLRRIFPQAWFYRGGSHLAVHASPPAGNPCHRLTRLGRCDGEAGRCLFRIIVTGK